MIREWLPITKRNRVALGFAVLALVMFVIWNLMPCYILGNFSNYPAFTREGRNFMRIWPEMINMDSFFYILKTPNFSGFLYIIASVSLLLNGLIVLILIPIWKILHASIYLRLTLALMNLLGGVVMMKFFFDIDDHAFVSANEKITLLLISFTMLTVFVSMMIFKNELQLRHERDAVETLNFKP